MIRSYISTLFVRLFAGIAGGLLGTISALGIFLFASFARPESAELEEPYSVVAILAMVFLGTLIANIFVALFLGLLEKSKYGRIRQTLFQVFVFTIILFLLSIPFYLFTSDSLIGTAGMHFLIASLMTALILEIMSSWRSALTGLLSVLWGGSFLYGIFSLLLNGAEAYSLLFIFFLPLAWVIIICSIFLVEVIHHSFFTLYRTHPLSPEQHHGDTSHKNP